MQRRRLGVPHFPGDAESIGLAERVAGAAAGADRFLQVPGGARMVARQPSRASQVGCSSPELASELWLCLISGGPAIWSPTVAQGKETAMGSLIEELRRREAAAWSAQP